jgi:hypothetical protein
MSKLILKISLLRLVEIVIMYFTLNWIYANASEAYGVWIVVGMLALYIAYAAMQTYNEYREEVYGDENTL